MHQMREVSYYFRQVRPYTRAITTAPTNAESSTVAVQVASDLSSDKAVFVQILQRLHLKRLGFTYICRQQIGAHMHMYVQILQSF